MLMMGVNAVAAPLGGWVSDRLPPAYLTTVALMIAAGAMAWFTPLGAKASVTQVAMRLIWVGVGMGLFQAANATLIMSSNPPQSTRHGGCPSRDVAQYGDGLKCRIDGRIVCESSRCPHARIRTL